MNAPVRLVCPECGFSADGDGARPDESFASCSCGGMRRGSSSSAGSGVSPADFVGSLSVGDGRPPRDQHRSVGRFLIREPLDDERGVPVFRAYDPQLDRDVKVKVLEGEPDARAEDRFLSEARVAARLDHPNILRLYDCDRDDERRWIAYQFVAGSTLAEHHLDHPVDASAAARIVRDLAGALEHAHRRGVCHGDVKPADVRIDGLGRIRLSGFGRVQHVDNDPMKTRRDAVTPITDDPSLGQVLGDGEPGGTASDVHALGVLLHGLLSGDCTGDTAFRPLDRSVPPTLRRICRRALSSDPGLHYPDVRNFTADLDNWTRRRNPLSRLPRLNRSLRLAIVVGALLAAIWIERDIEARSRRPGKAVPTPASSALSARMPKMVVRKETQSAGSPSTFYVEKGKRVFHASNCAASRDVPTETRFTFASPREAEQLGYIRCALCLPLGR